MRGACVSFWLHGPRSISRGCVPDMIEEIEPLLLYPLRMLGTGHCCVKYGFTAAPDSERSPCRPRDGLGVPAIRVRHGSTFDVQRSIQPPSPLDPFLTFCPSSFPFASPQNQLPPISGSSLLALSSCQGNSVRDASSVEPSLENTNPRTRRSLFLEPPSSFLYVPCHPFVEFPLPSFTFLFYLASDTGLHRPLLLV